MKNIGIGPMVSYQGVFKGQERQALRYEFRFEKAKGR